MQNYNLKIYNKYVILLYNSYYLYYYILDNYF